MIVYPPKGEHSEAPNKKYYHYGDNVIQATDPRPPPSEEASFPDGWTKEFDADGDAFFMDHNSGESR